MLPNWKNSIIKFLSICLGLALVFSPATGHSSGLANGHSQDARSLYWLKIKAGNKYQRSALARTGISLEIFSDDYVIAIGTKDQRDLLAKKHLLLANFMLDEVGWDFPSGDTDFHTYDRMQKELEDLVKTYPGLASLDSLGQSVENRQIWRLRISKDPATASTKPGIAYMGGHHAREHLSIEMPLLLAKYFLEEYKKGNADVIRLVDSRDIHIVPMVNPDGAEYDIDGAQYHMWRKNRSKNSDGTFGVDLNRNYGYQWGTGGSSTDTNSEVYMGTQPFSEPETQAIKKFFDTQTNVSSFISFHSFSELILYPWGYSYNPVSDGRDLLVFKKMAETMAQWNSYTPEQASDLYIASGDTVDWAYGAHKVFGFTFELDPTDMYSGGGFYPGQAVIPQVFQKNLKPALYMLEYADNPYRVLNPTLSNFGLNYMSIQ